MFPSPNSFNPFDHQSSFKLSSSSSSSSFIHQNPNHSKTDHDQPPFFLSFPSPFFDEHDLPVNQILLQNNHLIMAGNNLYAPDQVNNTNITDLSDPAVKKNVADQAITGVKSGPSIRRSRNLGAIPRRRAGKKDRHSKICTAQGIRDRRMRLSLQIARKFFDLQDMLGYDKASKTIEWLFTKSKKAITELAKDNPQGLLNVSTSDAKSESFVSECEVVSGLVEENIVSNNDVKESVVQEGKTVSFSVSPNVEKDEREITTKPKPNLRSESRERARARARFRTREKMMVKILEDSGKSNPNDNDELQKLGFVTGDGDQEYSNFNNQERVSNLYGNLYNSLEHQFGDVGTIEKLLGNSSSSSTYCPISDYHRSNVVSGYNLDSNSSFMGLLGNWDMLVNNERINSIQYGVTNDRVSLADNNPTSSIYSTTP